MKKTVIIVCFCVSLLQCQVRQKEPLVIVELENKVSRETMDEFKSAGFNNDLRTYVDSFYRSIHKSLETDTVSLNLLKQYGLAKNEYSEVFVLYWHRKLNAEDVSFEEYLSSIWEKREEQKATRKQRRLSSLQVCDKFEIGDSLRFKFPVMERSNGYRSVFLFNHAENNSWKFEPENDLTLNGELLGFAFSTDSICQLEMKILDLNRTDTYFLMEEIGPGDVVLIPAHELYLDTQLSEE